MRTLHLTLKKNWFDMILSTEKKEEYRELKPYWHKRLRPFFTDEETPKQIIFKNGYQKDAPTMIVELKTIKTSLGLVQWGAPENECVYILELGNIIETSNLRA